MTLAQPAKDGETIKKNVRELFEKFLGENEFEIRRVGVKVSGFSREEPRQKQLTSFFQPVRENHQKIPLTIHQENSGCFG